jgi:hypothetical protein
VALDRGWRAVAANAGVGPLIAAADPELLKPPINVMRLSLHPRGLAPLIVNLAQWRAHLLERLRRQLRASFDPEIDRLLREVESYPAPAERAGRQTAADEFHEVAIPLRIRTATGILSFLSSVCVFGTAIDITLAELTLELFFPEDAFTARLLLDRQVAAPSSPPQD